MNAGRCLGRRPSPNDRRTIKLAAYVDTAKLGAPLARSWSVHDGRPLAVSMFANDALGDCTCAALAHHDQICAGQLGAISPLTAEDVKTLYRGSGWTPADPTSDQGWSNLDAAKAARRAGWLEGFAAFDVGNRMLLELVINEFGGAYCGVELPVSAQRQTGGGRWWDVAPAGQRGDDYDRGSWGGHAVTVVDFDHEGVKLVTWGAIQRATWSFVFTYFDEGIAVLNRFWAQRELAPAGVDVAQLRADIARLVASP